MTVKKNRALDGKPCANCGAILSGRYCAQCAQDSHANLTVRHFLEEFVEGVAHFDSTFWRTFLPLLFKPGLLTVEYLSGKRKFYAPPLRTYLVISVAYFLLTSLFHTMNSNLSEMSTIRMEPENCPQYAMAMNWLRPFVTDIEGSCRRALADHRHEIDHALSGMLPKVMFVVLPLVALVQFWMWHRRRPLYVENLIFILHFQSFYYLVGALFALLAAGTAWIFKTTPQNVGGSLEAVWYVWVLIYLFIACRRVYGAGKFKTTLSILALFIAYLIFWSLAEAVVGMYLMLHA